MKLIGSVVTASALCAGLGVMLGTVRVFGAIGGQSVDPSQKARMLAEGISETMNSVAFGLLIWLPSTIIGLWMTSSNKQR
jgi:biopolymer transport protein ExbB/TolQ